MVLDPRVGYQYTVFPSREEAKAVQDDLWKGDLKKEAYSELVGLTDVGVRNAYTKILEHYDEMIKGWLDTFEILSADGKEVIPVTNIVYGTPERVFAVNKSAGIGSVTSRVSLPAISFRRSGMTRNYSRGATLRNARRDLVYSDDRFKNYVEIASTYHLVDIEYDVSFITKYQTEMQMLLEQALLPQGPQSYFRLVVPELDFDQFIMCKLGANISDGSTLDPNEGERVLKTSVVLELEAYIPIKVSRIARTIRNLATNFNFTVSGNRYCTPDTTAITTLWENTVYTYVQTTPATSWIIIHNLGHTVSPTVNDSTNALLTDYTIDSNTATTLVMTFPTATAGTAFLL
jgi:hypothetical protein